MGASGQGEIISLLDRTEASFHIRCKYKTVNEESSVIKFKFLRDKDNIFLQQVKILDTCY